MIRALDRKLLRDVWDMKGQTIAICLVIACGVATFVMSLTTLRSLQETRTAYYERYRFAEVFTNLKRAPLSLRERIEDIPGVARVQTRVVADVTLDVPGLNEPASGRIISLPEYGEPVLNRLHLRAGRMPEPGRRGEVVASEAFMLAHNFEPGVRIRAVINGNRETLNVVGIVLSPEYVFSLGPGALLPDDKRFGVFWMRYEELAPGFDMDGAFNDVALTLMAGAAEKEVIRRLNRLTTPYGGDGAYGRDDQLSYRFLSDEIKQLRATGLIAPSIFLSVAAFLLNVVLSRLISTQREQIAALKAFGYSNWEVGLHYMKLVLFVVVLGVGLGSAVGAWLAKGMTGMYQKFYHFPLLYFEFSPGTVALALGMASAAAVLGCIGAVRKAVKLPPAEAMRPEPPADFRPTLVERIGLQRAFSPMARMVLRNLERKPWQAILSICGIALAAAILVLGAFSQDSIEYLMEFQFKMSQRQEVTLTFNEPTAPQGIYEVDHLPGVIYAEPFRSVSVRMRHGHRERRLGIIGLIENKRLNLVLDRGEEEIKLPRRGMVISTKLAELLAVRPGNAVRVEVLQGKRPVLDVPVTGLVDDYAGTNAYMEVHALHDLLDEGPSYSGAYLMVDSAKLPELYRELKETPRVASVSIQEAAVTSFRETIAENMGRFRTFNVIFACIIAAGVVYNTARISLAERSRELATMRVMGFTRGEISAILLGELAIITLAAIPFGLALGYGMAAFAVWALETELFRIPLVVAPATFAFAALVVLIAAVVSGLVVRRRLDHLDLVAVLKSRE